MVKKVTYNLNFLAKAVFELDEEYQKILRILARQREHVIGINQTQITRRFENTENSFTRRTIHKKLFGTNKTMGLIPAEYIIQRKENKKRYGKLETTFHLTFKGLFGALASGVPLKRIYIYKKFLDAVDHHIIDPKISKIIKKYYELQIQSFLLWHYIYGIQLKKLTTFQTYFSDFMERRFSHTFWFGITINPNIIQASREPEKISYSEKSHHVMHLVKKRQEEKKEYIAEIREVFSSYFTYKGIISLLRKNGLIPTTNDFLKPDSDIGDPRKHFIPDTDDSREAHIFDNLIDNWSIHIEGVYQAETLDDALFNDEYEIPNQPNVTFVPQEYDLDRKRQEKLKEIEKQISLKQVKPEEKETKIYEYMKEQQKELEEVEKKANVVLISNITDKIKDILKENKIQIDIPVNRPLSVYPF